MNQRGYVNRRSFRLSQHLGVVLLVAAVGSCSGGDPVGPGAGVPTALVMVGGDGQVAQISTTLVQDFVVRVEDVNGDPVASIPVAWAVSAGGGSITPPSDATDAAGESQARLDLGLD